MNPKAIRGSLPEICRNCNYSFGSILPGLNTSYCQTAQFLWPFNTTSKTWQRHRILAAAFGTSWCESGSPNPAQRRTGTRSRNHLAPSASSPPYIIITSFQDSSSLRPPPSSGLAHTAMANRKATLTATLLGPASVWRGRDGCLGWKPTPAGLSPFSPGASEVLQRGCLQRR